MPEIQKYFPYDHAKLSIEGEEDLATIARICNALSSEFRLNLLRQISATQPTILELAKSNFVAMSTMVFHINILEEAGLVNIEYIQGVRGPIRKCFPKLERLNVFLRTFASTENQTKISHSMGVGQFVDSAGTSNDCSFATKEKIYQASWGALYARERFDAQIFWTRCGYVTYAFPNDFYRNPCTEIAISLELCSEAYSHDENYKSDITFWINGIELFTYTCPGDYGDRRGIFNPDWWPESWSQYGELKTIKVNRHGVFLNDHLVNPKIKLTDLQLDQGDRMLFKLGNKENARYVGGFNLFGKGFGDYDQDIVLSATLLGETDG